MSEPDTSDWGTDDWEVAEETEQRMHSRDWEWVWVLVYTLLFAAWLYGIMNIDKLIHLERAPF